MMPTSPSAWNSFGVEHVSNRFESLPLGTSGLNSSNDGLLLRLVDEARRVERVGLLAEGTTGKVRHPAAVRLMP
jgi:hypothetical protein